ncbi:MAG: class I SAM-dependent methyltransferase [Candidatus Heimdallarchaeota archaeon]|nr:class I SAM-dependent methyltransferase [Candidatus Heimdallarchaeota archaeon]MCK4290492.1 class I SAM-dependent methyltransferase [Candidatus Heimdallarchaeota archaeon]
MDSEKNWLDVPAPDKWMTGWDNYHKKILEGSEKLLQDLSFITPPVQVVGLNIYGKAKGLQALDLGCGDGRYACFLAHLGCDVFAIDALESAIEITNKRAKILGLEKQLRAEQKNIEDLPLEPESYDIIVSVQVLQYLFDEAVSKLKEIAVAIKPGGFVAYSGNIPPHFETDPPMKFIYEKELRDIFEGWTLLSVGRDERLLRPGDLRGYVWIVAKKPTEEEKKEKKN